MPSKKKINKLTQKLSNLNLSAKKIEDDKIGLPDSEFRPVYPKKNINELITNFSYNRTFNDISKVITDHTSGGWESRKKLKPIKKKKKLNHRIITKHKPWSSYKEKLYFESKYMKWSIKENNFDPSSRFGSTSSTPVIIKNIEVETVIPGSARAKELFRTAKKFGVNNRSNSTTTSREYDHLSCSWFENDRTSGNSRNNSGNKVSTVGNNVFTTESDVNARPKVRKEDFKIKSTADLLEYENIILDRHNTLKHNYEQENDTTRTTRDCLNYGDVCDTGDDDCCDDLYCEEYDNTCHSSGPPDVLGQPFWWNAIDYVLRGKCDGAVMPNWVDCDESNPNYERRPFVCGHSLGEAAGGGYGCFPLQDADQDGVISLVDVQAIMCKIEPTLFCRNPGELCGCNAVATNAEYEAYGWDYEKYLETLQCFYDQPNGEKDVWLCPSYFWNGGGDTTAYFDAGGTNPLGFPIEAGIRPGNYDRSCGPAIWVRPNLNGGAIANMDSENPPYATRGINHPSVIGGQASGWSVARFGRDNNTFHKGFFDALCRNDNACGRCGDITSDRKYGDCLITLEGASCPTSDFAGDGGMPVTRGNNSGLPYDEFSLRNPYNPLHCWYTGECESGEQPIPNFSGEWLPNQNEEVSLTEDGGQFRGHRYGDYADGMMTNLNYHLIQ